MLCSTATGACSFGESDVSPSAAYPDLLPAEEPPGDELPGDEPPEDDPLPSTDAPEPSAVSVAVSWTSTAPDGVTG